MCEDSRASSGRHTAFEPYETRRIVWAEGTEFHDSDSQAQEAWRTRMINVLGTDPASFRSDPQSLALYERNRSLARGLTDAQTGTKIRETLIRWGPVSSHIDFLQQNLGADFQLTGDRKNARFVNSRQRVNYEIEFIHRKTRFKEALETEGIIVIYQGHSRYGRGACFDQYSGASTKHGEMWEDGTTTDNGLFRLAYPYLPVELHDVEHHQYHFAPIPVEEPRPSRRDWRRYPKEMHPDGRRRFSRILLPENLRQYVKPAFASPSHSYWGISRRGKHSLILLADWEDTAASPADLGAVELNCRTFCHFGCSTRKHFWNIVRRPEYKGYQRTRPPTDKFAYFTTEPATHHVVYWLYYLLSYSRANGPTHWWDSHEYAKRMANRRLRRERWSFRIY